MANLAYGSSGSEVKKMQEALVAAGYDVGSSGADGVFGANTQTAVRKYQQDHGLAVDGIAGNNTLGSLYSSNTAAATPTPGVSTPATTQTATTTTESTGFTYEPYKPSDTVAQAEALLQQQLSQKPGAYSSQWQGQINSILGQIQGREDFSYDVNADAMYQQLKDQYVLQGQMAMMDTMGQAAALTGGYGNSYAQTAGQQAYQGYLQQLTEQVPELQQMAYERYAREGQEMYDQLGLYMGMDEQDYGRYQDSLSAYYTELDRLAEDARYQGEQEYGRWADKLNLDYGMYRDQVADQQWQKEFDENMRRYNQELALAQSESSGSSSGGSGGSTGGGTGGTGGGGYDANTAKIQQQLKDAGYDIAVDGIWGPQTQAAYDDYNSGGDVVLEDSAAAKSFRASLMDGTTFARHGNKVFMGEAGNGGQVYTFDSYNEYIEAAIDRELEAGRISDDDAAFLYNLYFNK